MERFSRSVMDGNHPTLSVSGHIGSTYDRPREAESDYKRRRYAENNGPPDTREGIRSPVSIKPMR